MVDKPTKSTFCPAHFQIDRFLSVKVRYRVDWVQMEICGFRHFRNLSILALDFSVHWTWYETHKRYIYIYILILIEKFGRTKGILLAWYKIAKFRQTFKRENLVFRQSWVSNLVFYNSVFYHIKIKRSLHKKKHFKNAFDFIL